MDERLVPATQEERVMAAVSHASVLMPTTGIVVPILVWASQKDKSPYLRSQALQATVFHLSMVVAMMLGVGLYLVSAFGVALGGIALESMGPQAEPYLLAGFAIPMLTIVVVMLLQFGMMAYGLFGAVLALTGRPFRYAVIGSWLDSKDAAAAAV